ncbi:MAG: 50S ribosomal protein L9 [Candidatus Kerfeldbacteria bacterium]|nr:50S ribosomal protein L9 [Candidatus Kerfeldbacteria bacterium]
MKIILLQTVPGRGPRGTVIEVHEAFARNYLIPKRLGRPATTTDLAQANQKKEAELLARQGLVRLVSQVKQRMPGTQIQVRSKANHQGRLFATVKGAEVGGRIVQLYRLPSTVHLTVSPSHFKTVGLHQAQVTWPDRTKSSVTVEIQDVKKPTSGPSTGTSAV